MKKMNKWLGALLGLLLWIMMLSGTVLIFLDNDIYKTIGVGLYTAVTAIYIYIKRTYHLPVDYDSGANKDNYDVESKSNDSNSGLVSVNPASGALMMGGVGGVDTFGNSYGSDVSGSFND